MTTQEQQLAAAVQREVIEIHRVEGEPPVIVTLALGTPVGKMGFSGGYFTLYYTTAPKGYDYPDVIPVWEYEGVRWVLLHDKYQVNQLARYSSGLFEYGLSVDPTPNGVLATLWERLHGRN